MLIMSLLHTKLYLKSSESNNEQMRGCNSGPQCNFNHSQSALVFPIFSVFRLAFLLLTHCPQQFGIRQHIYLTSLHLTFIWTFPTALCLHATDILEDCSPSSLLFLHLCFVWYPLRSTIHISNENSTQVAPCLPLGAISWIELYFFSPKLLQNFYCIIFKNLHLFILCMNMPGTMWKSENNLWDLVFFLHHTGSVAPTQFIRQAPFPTEPCSRILFHCFWCNRSDRSDSHVPPYHWC